MNDNAPRGTALFLCDITGKMAEPWVQAGYRAVLVDPQHPAGVHDDGSVVRVGAVITEALDYIGALVRGGLVFVAGFPPCTDVAVSGARWWEAKRKADPYFQAKAAMVAEQCRMTGELSGAAWMFENPVSAFSKMFGPANHSFNPHDFTGYCANDNYTKKTCLWTGGGFVMPAANRNTELGAPDNRIHTAPPGDERANFRSATPMGFAKAVFLSNAPHLKVAANDNQQQAATRHNRRGNAMDNYDGSARGGIGYGARLARFIIGGDLTTCCERNGVSNCDQGRNCPQTCQPKPLRDYDVRVVRNDRPTVQYNTRAQSSFEAHDKAREQYGHQAFVSVKPGRAA